MGKVFGYPEFDANGEKILTTYDNEYKEMLMDIRVFRLSAGDVKTFCKKEEETAVLLLKGDVVFSFDGTSKEVTRKDVFTEGPWAVHRKMHRGDIPVQVNSETWQNAVSIQFLTMT